MNHKKVSILLISILSLAIGCNKKSEEKAAAKIEILPLLLPEIQKTTPSTTTGSMLASVPSTKEQALVDFFSNTFSGISGTSAKGFINASIGDLDSRITELNNRFETEPSCYSETPYSWTISTDSPVNYSITLKVSCLDKFSTGGSSQSGAGSGMAWGRDDNYYYLALILFQTNGTDKFGYFAKYNRSTKAVDLLFLDDSQSYSRGTVYRVITDSESKKFQMALAGYNFSSGPMFPALGCNTRMISDGTELLVAGKAGETNSTGVCSTGSGYVFDGKCYSSSSVTTTTATCSSLSTSSFATELTEFDGTQVYIARTTIGSAISLSALDGNVSPVQ